MADVTNKNLRLNGINQLTNFVEQNAYLLDFTEIGVTATGTHDLIDIPAGTAVVKLKLFAVEGVTSGGSATLQFKVHDGNTADNINSTALAIANLADGDVTEIVVNGTKGIVSEKGGKLQLAIGTAALTGGKVVMVVETIPILKFLLNG